MDRDVYVAIADPMRREIIDLLNTTEMLSAGEIAEEFASVTRPAVSRQLRILRECGLVKVQRSGKHQLYVLNTEPLEFIRNGWLKGFASRHTKSLKALRRKVESRLQ